MKFKQVPATDAEKHNYNRKIRKLFEEGKFKPGLHHVTINHDNWCGLYKGRYCNCNPDIVIHNPLSNFPLDN